MKIVKDAVKLGNSIDPKHEVELFCAACGHDIDEAELDEGTCSDCGKALNLRQNTKIYATSVPPAGGSTLV